MFQDLRSPKAKAKADREQKARERKRAKLAKQLAAAVSASAGKWQRIDTCPFEALDEEYGLDGAVWVTDGKEIALATVTRRFGRPLRVIKQPEMAMTDRGISYVGGEYAEIDAPAWWFEWEFQDQFETTISYGDTVHCEVDFIATHWMPAKPALPAP